MNINAVPGFADSKPIEAFFSDFKIEGEKIYVNPEQVLLTDEGIIIQGIESQLVVRQLNSDFNGLYFLRSEACHCGYTCPRGHNIWCSICRGCDGWDCRYACKCRR